MTDGQLDTAIFDGEAARALLSNEVLMKALAECERTATEKMITALDVAVREENWYLTRAVRELKAQLLKFANSGTAAKETKAKRARNGQK
ncbi:hypothetical protein AB4Y36_03475 [Paraburkholderia sp. BR10936]|uniref:hypothetical protein n=1 Tax=Paraburkholderia sp. BR10936 TaxID=3236993 RepID=UPI0034D1628B